jgi:hypothetical protein
MLTLDRLEKTTGHSESWIQGFQDAYNSYGWEPGEWDALDYEEGYSEGMSRLCRWMNRRR